MRDASAIISTGSAFGSLAVATSSGVRVPATPQGKAVRPDGFRIDKVQVRGATAGQVANGPASGAEESTREIRGRICLRSLR